MIIENGTIEFKEKHAGGINPLTGYPRKATDVEWVHTIPCQWIANSRNDLGRVNGERFSVASFTVLVEEQPLPSSRQVRLKDDRGKLLGEFTMVADPEPLTAVGQLKILL